MRRLPDRMLIALAAVTIFACVIACSRTADKAAGPAEKATIAYSAPPYSVLVDIAQKQGYFLQAGLETTPLTYPYGKLALDALLEGKADFATAGETPVMFAIMKGRKISIIATIQTSNLNNAVIARRHKGILAPRDLKGMRIAVTFGTVGEFFLDAFLAVNGVSRGDVRMINMGPDEMQEALASGSVDAVSSWSPVTLSLQKKLGDKVITFHNEDVYTQSFNVVATQEYVRKNPVKVKKLLLAIIEAEKFAARSPEDAKKIIADISPLNRDLVGEMWDRNKFSVTLDQSLVLALEDESRWAITSRLTKETNVPNYLDFIYLDGLLSVKPEAVRILR